MTVLISARYLHAFSLLSLAAGFLLLALLLIRHLIISEASQLPYPLRKCVVREGAKRVARFTWIASSVLLAALLSGCCLLAVRPLQITILVTCFVLAFLLIAVRPRSREWVRQEIVAAGGTICVQCGYDLRGQQGDSSHCPECGVNSCGARRDA